MRTATLSIMGILTLACNEGELGSLKDLNQSMGMDIEVTPSALDFGLLSYEDPATIRTFTISSVGVDPATVSSIEIQGDEATSFTLLMPFEETVLDPGESIDVQVAFQPMNSNMLYAEAIVFSDDPDESSIPVALVGQGSAPNLLITPAPLNFGVTYVGCDMDNEITLSNIGQEDLVIYSIGGLAEPFLSEAMPTFPLTLAPQETHTLYVDFVPTLEGQYTDMLEVTSNDPDGPQAVDFSGIGQYVASDQQNWANPVDPPSDILFVVDRSGSMNTYTNQLAANFQTFINELSNYAADWQIMVVTDDDGCSNWSGILTANTPNYQSLFSSGVSNGGNGGDIGLTERLVEMAQVAINNTDPGECNAGFLRNNAMLHVVMVTDEKEHSPIPVVDLVNDIIAHKGGNPDNVKMTAIYNPNDDLDLRYESAVNMTGGLLFDITNSSANNWASPANLQLLAEASVITDRYNLDQPAVESSIEVYINGYFVQGNWHYDEAQQAVFFDSNPPGEGDTIEIRYSVLAECEQSRAEQ